jgi:hypothetical protein
MRPRIEIVGVLRRHRCPPGLELSDVDVQAEAGDHRLTWKSPVARPVK